MAAERSLAVASMPVATVARPRHLAVQWCPAMDASASAMYPSFPAGLSIGRGVGSPRWTNALAVDTKAMTAFGHGPCRLLERST
jgi:hypothetical protein